MEKHHWDRPSGKFTVSLPWSVSYPVLLGSRPVQWNDRVKHCVREHESNARTD